jgi:hypothetical protein
MKCLNELSVYGGRGKQRVRKSAVESEMMVYDLTIEEMMNKRVVFSFRAY